MDACRRPEDDNPTQLRASAAKRGRQSKGGRKANPLTAAVVTVGFVSAERCLWTRRVVRAALAEGELFLHGRSLAQNHYLSGLDERCGSRSCCELHLSRRFG